MKRAYFLNMKYTFFSLRPEQWIKNLFIFLPLIFGKKLFVFPVILKALAAFSLFSLTAGVVYLINDIMDYERDKIHPLKHLRPIASGKISIRWAGVAAFILGILSIVLSFILDISFGWVIVAYLIFNYIYSKILKEVVIIDVLCISGFFLLRLMAGSFVAKVQLSHWIIFMILLLALFLGFNKRRQELVITLKESSLARPVLKRYNLYFIDLMNQVVTSSLIICYMLYTVDYQTVERFGTTNLIYSIPFVYYGIFRYLYLIHKIKFDGDPVSILLHDKMMKIDLFLWILICIVVIYFGNVLNCLNLQN